MTKKTMKENFCTIFRQIWKKSWGWIVLLLAMGILHFAIWGIPKGFMEWFVGTASSLWKLLFLTVFVFLAISVCRRLTDYYSLKRNENGITWCQISILIASILWFFGFLLIFDIHKESRSFLVLGIIGTMLGWVFQDTIKGVAAFIHLRWNKLLSIGDWIQVPNLNVDGEVTHITLTTVTICNWDTTTSSIPTSVLRSDHFVNLRNMTAGKTYGRLMTKTFILDTGWFFAITADDAEQLKEKEELKRYLPTEEIKEGATNAHLFRLYLYHWLMANLHVSQMPRLVVRWLEQKEAGMPLQVYAFITEGSMPAFEWQQSKIIEHVLESLDWFGLRLYQTPSSFDVSNSNIHMTQAESVYRKEIGK